MIVSYHRGVIAGRIAWVVAAAALLPGCTRPNLAFGDAREDGGRESTGTPGSSSGLETGLGSGDATTSGGSGSGGSSSGSSSSVGESGSAGSTDTGSGPATVCGYDPSLVVLVSDELPLPTLSSGAFERDPFVVVDGSSLFFSADLGEGPRIYVAPAAEGGFGVPGPTLDGVTMLDGVLKISYAEDERVAVVSAALGGFASYDLWLLQRESPVDPFGFPDDFERLEALAVTGNAYDPHLSADGRRLYFSPQDGSPEGQAIYVASRDGLDVTFGRATRIAALDVPGGGEADPTLTHDERVIVFTADDGAGTLGLWIAHREELDAAFTKPRLLGQLGRVGNVGHAHISADGCDLWFVNAELGTPDIWHARAMPA